MARSKDTNKQPSAVRAHAAGEIKETTEIKDTASSNGSSSNGEASKPTFSTMMVVPDKPPSEALDVEASEAEETEFSDLEDLEATEAEETELSDLDDLEDLEVTEAEETELSDLDDLEVTEAEEIELGDLDDVEATEAEEIELEEIELDDLDDVERSQEAQPDGVPGTEVDTTERSLDTTPANSVAVRGESSESNLFPRRPAVSMENVVPEADLEPLAEAVRYILARPQVAIDTELPSRVAVVSALPGEGVTTVSSIFSAVLSTDSDVETCRVDLSWNSAATPGVYEVLMGTATVEDVLEWNGSSSTLHSGGVGPYERHRLARSEELDALVTVLAGRFKHVVLDLPPLLRGSDGLSMMRFADAYLLVVKHGVTTLQQVQIATEQLGDTETIGTVLNQVRTRTPRPLSRWLN